MKKFILLGLLVSLTLSFKLKAQLTYKDVAGIFYARCTSCHHAGANHYSYQNYAGVFANRNLIQNDLNINKMPPWKADTTYSRFEHERLISAQEKSDILNWIATGATKGDTTLAPAEPVYPPKYQLVGNADLSLTIPTFSSFASTQDIYVCFSLPTNLTQTRIVRAYEVVPGDATIVHHAVITADSTGMSTSDLSGACINQPGNIGLGTYAPGSKAKIFPSQAPLKLGVTLKAGSNVIMQIHYPKGTYGKADSTKIRLYFYPPGETGVRELYMTTPLQNWSMSIPANTTRTFTATYPTAPATFTSAVSLYGVFPHSHVIAQGMLLYAVNPGIDTIPLIRINDWDFNWQDFYIYKNLLKLPIGYRIFAQHIYNNTTSNLNNPHNPPIAVNAGLSTTDEMLFDGIMATDYQTGDELIDMQAIVDADTLYATGVKQNYLSTINIRAQAYPNPFTNEVKIKYLIGESMPINIEITDVLGKTILSQSEGKKDAGMNEFNWSGKNKNGQAVPNGIYFYNIKAGNHSFKDKIIKQD